MPTSLLSLPYPNIVYLCIFSVKKCDAESEITYLSRNGEHCGGIRIKRMVCAYEHHALTIIVYDGSDNNNCIGYEVITDWG